MTEKRKEYYKNLNDEDIDKLLNGITHALKVEKKYNSYNHHNDEQSIKDIKNTIPISGSPIDKIK